MGRKLYVGNLPYETNEQDLQELFTQAGNVETVTVMRDRDTGRARGFAFVEMSSDDEAQNAAKETLATTLMGYARAHPQRIRGRLMPVIVYDPAAGRRAFSVAMQKLRG